MISKLEMLKLQLTFIGKKSSGTTNFASNIGIDDILIEINSGK